MIETPTILGLVITCASAFGVALVGLLTYIAGKSLSRLEDLSNGVIKLSSEFVAHVAKTDARMEILFEHVADCNDRHLEAMKEISEIKVKVAARIK